MAGCTESRKAECRAQGKVCNPKSGRCKVPEAAKTASKGKKRAGSRPSTPRSGKRSRAASPGTSLVQGAILEQVGTPTAMSLQLKRRSSKLDAGMPTLVDMTRAKLRKVPARGRKMPARRRGVKPSTRKLESQRMTVAMERAVRWASRIRKPGLVGACKPCTNPKRPVQHKETCRCYAAGSAALRKQGVCAPKTVTRRGKTITEHYVHAVVAGKHRCLKAGGQKAKQVLGAAGCPPGKVLKTVKRRNPRTGALVNGQQCVKAVGAYKDCPANQVIVSVRASGVVAGRPWSRTVQRCVTAKTAAKKGYNVVRAGTLPVPPTRRSQGKPRTQRARKPRRVSTTSLLLGPAMSPGM